jgi:hypothetical protein
VSAIELLEQLRQVIRYDPETGEFTWLVTGYKNRHPIGSRAGTLKDGYNQLNIDGRLYRGGRLAWLFMTGDWPPKGFDVDHRDTNRANDKWDNLRLLTRSGNNRNPSGLRSNNTVGARGVHRQPNGTFFARITVDGQNVHLGTFPTIEDAAAARAEAEEKYRL